MKEKIPILADRDIQHMANAVTGANAADTHLTGVNLHRDFQVDLFADLRNAVDGDPCPRCSATLALRHAIEVGHVFKLGTKYSEALGANSSTPTNNSTRLSWAATASASTGSSPG